MSSTPIGSPATPPLTVSAPVASPLPQIFLRGDVAAKMEAFRETTSSSVSKEQMDAYITNGEALCRQIGSNDPLPKRTLENVRDISWYLMAIAASKGEEHTSGTFRIDDPGDRLHTFLKGCGSYPRASTHFGARKKIVGEPHQGLDVGKQVLFANKRTLLFSKLGDGSTFIKFEEHGCPPFWKSGFNTWSNFMEFIQHAIDYLKSRSFVKKIFGESAHGNYKTRKEHIPGEIKQEFKHVVRLLNKADKKRLKTTKKASTSFKNTIASAVQARKDAAQQGISSMREQLKKEIETIKKEIDTLQKDLASSLTTEPDATADTHQPPSQKSTRLFLSKQQQQIALREAENLKSKLDAQLEQDGKSGYTKGRQGEEVVLPSFADFQRQVG